MAHTSKTTIKKRSFLREFRVELIGFKDVGKTTFILQLLQEPIEMNYESSFDDDEVTIWWDLNGVTYKIDLLDTAGTTYYHTRFIHPHAILVFYSVTNSQSLDVARGMLSWIHRYKREKHQQKVILIGTKNDLTSSRNVKTEAGVQVAAEFNVPFIELSVKDYSAVKQCFEFLLRELCLYHQQKLINTLMNGSLELKEEKKRLNKTKKLTLDDKLIDLSWAFNNPDLSDITFVFPGNTSETKKIIYAHKCVLHSRAEAWRENLRGPWSEKEVHIIDVPYDIFFEVLKFIYNGGSLQTITIDMTTAQRMVDVLRKYNLNSQSKLAEKIVFTLSMIERIKKLFGEVVERIDKISQHISHSSGGEYTTFLTVFQEQVLDIIETVLSLAFHIVKYFRLLLPHQKQELLDYIVLKVPKFLTGIGEILKNINEWFFSRVSKEERKEVSVFVLEKIRQFMNRLSEVLKRARSLLDQIDLKYLTITSRMKDAQSIDDVFNWWIRSGEKIQKISGQEFHRKFKKALKDFERVPEGIKKILGVDPLELKTTLEEVVSLVLKKLTSKEVITIIRSLYSDFKEIAEWAVTTLLQDCPNVKLLPLVKEILQFLSTPLSLSSTTTTTTTTTTTSSNNNLTIKTFIPSELEVQPITSPLSSTSSSSEVILSLGNTYDEDKVSFFQQNLTLDQLCLFDNDLWSDITFSFTTGTETKHIRAHKILLATHCIVFRRMFLGGFRESTQSVVPIEETDFDTFILLLYFIYNNGNLKKLIQSKEMTKASSSHGVENRVVSLLITAHKYQFDVLVNECEEYLISQISKMEMEDIISLLVIADTYHASKLKNSCLEYASCSLTDFNTLNLSDDLKKQIVESRRRFESKLLRVNALVLSGKSGVGKTSFINAALSVHDEDALCSAEFMEKTQKKLVKIDDQSENNVVELQFTEVSVSNKEQEIGRYLSAYPKESLDVILCLFSLSDFESLSSASSILTQWTNKRNYDLVTEEVQVGETIFKRYKAGFYHLPKIILLIGNKCDLPLSSLTSDAEEERLRITTSDLQQVSKTIGVEYITTSTVTSTNISKTIRRIARAALKINGILGLKSQTQQQSIKDPNMQTFLFLGIDGVGKSTILKQIKIIFGKRTLTSLEAKETKYTIAFQIVSMIKNLIRIAQTQVLSGNSVYELDPSLSKLIHTQKFLSKESNFDISELSIAKQLWNDQALKLVYVQRTTFNIRFDIKPLLDSKSTSAYTFDKPTLEDYILSYHRTQKQRFEGVYMGKKFRFIDVGGSRSDREKWKDCIEKFSVDVVIYVVSLADYAFSLDTEGKENYLLESLETWKNLCRSLPQSTSLYLVFNKVDDFKVLLESCKLRKCFSDATGIDELGFDDKLEFVMQQFLDVAKECGRKTQHIAITATNATDVNRLLLTLMTFFERQSSSNTNIQQSQ